MNIFYSRAIVTALAVIFFPVAIAPLSAETIADDADNTVEAANGRDVEQIIVTLPLHRTEAETALPIKVLQGDELRRSTASTIGETLETTPGLANAGFGPSVGQPVIRGQQGPRVTVLQNSLGSADASTVSADHAVSVEPVLADTIEVLRGPATLLYGGGAIGGVVNVVDGRVPVAVPGQASGALELRHATAADKDTAVMRLDGGSGAWAFHFSGLYRDANNLDIPVPAEADEDHDHGGDPILENSDSEAGLVTLGSSYVFDRGFIGLAVSGMENEYGVPGHEHEAGHGDEEETVRIDAEQTRYDLRSEYELNNGPWTSLHSFVTYSDYEHNELEGTEVGTQWKNESLEGRFEVLHKEVNGWRGIVGMQFKDRELSAQGEESYIPVTESQSYGLFLVESFQQDNVTWEFGARIDHDRHKPEVMAPKRDFDSFSFSASALWQANEQHSLGIAISSSQRAPVMEELYSNAGNSFGDYVEHVATGAIEVGNLSLDNEQSNNIDLTWSYSGEWLEGYITLFHNDFDDYISLQNIDMPQGDVPVYEYTQSSATFSGVEFETALHIGKLSNGELSVELFGDWIEGDIDAVGDAPRLPPLRVGTRVNYSGDKLATWVSFVHANKQDKPGLNESETGNYQRIDAGVEYKLESPHNADYLLFLRGKNLGDDEIRQSTSFLRDVAPDAGRSIESGVRLVF